MVVRIRDEQKILVRIHGYVRGSIQISGRCELCRISLESLVAVAGPSVDVVVGLEDANAMVAGVGNIEIPHFPDRRTPGRPQAGISCWPGVADVAGDTDRARDPLDVASTRTEIHRADRVVSRVRDVVVAIAVEDHAGGVSQARGVGGGAVARRPGGIDRTGDSIDIVVAVDPPDAVVARVPR